MIIEMKGQSEGVNLGVVGFTVQKLQDKGCDVLINQNNGHLVIAAFGPGENSLDFQFMEGLPLVKRWNRDNKIFVLSDGQGFEEAWRTLQLLENRH